MTPRSERLGTLFRRLGTTFIALRHYNYRLWFFGQTVSLMGTWMQSVAQQWLVYQMTNSKLALGVISFSGSVATIFLMLPAGALADRFPKKRLLLITQTAMMLQAFAMTVLKATELLRVWHIALLAFLLGVANSFDAPARQSLAVEMVEDRHDLGNAIALNSTMFNMARIVGPTVAGLVLVAWGSTWCFAINGLSFMAVIVALLFMRLPEAPAKLKVEPLARQVRTGLRYIRGNVLVMTIIALVAVSSLFGFTYSVLVPVYARDILSSGNEQMAKMVQGNLLTAVGIGALVGSLLVASLGRSRRKGMLLAVGSLLFPGAVLAFAFSRHLPFSLACLALAGFGFVTQNATSNTLIQTIVPDELRGRVMSVYMLMFFGTIPFAALLAGGVGQWLGPTWGVAIGGGVTLLFALWVLIAVPRLRRLEGV